MSGAPPPFSRARGADKRLKLFLWGDSGAGKTSLALQFPNPVVIDLEGGSDLYADRYRFDVVRATGADEVMEAVKWLLEHSHPYETIVIDPITVYWDALQKKWSDIFLRRNPDSKGFKFEFFDFQPRDWMTMKAELKDLLRKLVALDMNVVVTARQKPLYSDRGFMQLVGSTFDAEKSLPYLFDTVIHLYRDDKGRFMAQCRKDRTRLLPLDPFECGYAHFENLIAADPANHVPEEPATDEQKLEIRTKLAELELPYEQVAERLSTYGARTLNDLTTENAALILEKIMASTSQPRTREEQHEIESEQP